MKPAALSGMLRVRSGPQAGAGSMSEITAVLTHWQLDVRQVRERMYRAATPRERERWHALWLAAQGWSASKVAELLERDAHTIGGWLAAFERDGPVALAFEQTGGPPPPRPRGAGGAEGRSAGHAARGRHRPGELELEGGPSVRRGSLRGPAVPQRLHALPAPAGLRIQA